MKEAKQLPAKGRRGWLLACVALGSLLVAVSAVALLAVFLTFPERFDAGAGSATRRQLVGTWSGVHGVTMQLRADGTARSRRIACPADISYFEWSASDEELSIFIGDHDRRVQRVLHRYATGGEPTSRFEILRITPTELEVRDTESGNRHTFTRTSDRMLDAAP